MEGLSVVANSKPLFSHSSFNGTDGFQLSETCVKLYHFWESIKEAPEEIAAIKEDLRYLISVFRRVESAGQPLGPCIAEGVRHCRIKVAV
jgi:hypothetical protein